MDIIQYQHDVSDRALIHVSDSDPGYIRIRRGKGFIYFSDGLRIEDMTIIERINNLKIPPNWKNVWICKYPNGYLQATGFDAKGRKQYLYHKEWTNFQQETKFEKLLEFGNALPLIRQTIEKDLKEPGWPKEKVLALVISLLDEYYLRIGNPQYRDTNDTYGLTTLRRKHLTINNDSVIFSYKGKSNVYRNIAITNKKFVRLIKLCSELPGYEVFRYLTDEGKSMPVTSHDVNEYLETITGHRFTSKTFRTWAGTTLALKKIDEAKEEIKNNKRAKLRKVIIKKVAVELGNTAAVCEQYYIHPKVLKIINEEDFSPEKIKTGQTIPGLTEEETALLNVLNE